MGSLSLWIRRHRRGSRRPQQQLARSTFEAIDGVVGAAMVWTWVSVNSRLWEEKESKEGELGEAHRFFVSVLRQQVQGFPSC